MFGVPGGGSNLDVIGACQEAGIEFVLGRGETAAAIMAATCGELTRSPGACVVTRGPGAASAINGVAHALLDRAPMVIVTDAVPGAQAPRISHQRLDQTALLEPVTKWSVSVGADNAAEVAERAVRVACEPPAGPVHLNVDGGAASSAPPDPPAQQPPAGDADRARELVAASRSPVVAVGVGARAAAASVRSALARLECPKLLTYKAKGIVPESPDGAAGLLTGAMIEADVLHGADLIVAIGVDPVELIPAPWPYDAPVLSLAGWASDSSYFEPAAELVGDLEESLAHLEPLAALPGGQVENGFAALRRALDVRGEGLLAQDVVRAARAAFPRGTVATIDSGAHMFPAMAFWSVDEPGEALISSGLATMGFALPAAVAAARLTRERVVCLTGDGGLGMALAELETLARYSLPVTVIVFNDAALSLIEIKQQARQGGQNAVRYSDVDFAAVAGGLGLPARRVETVAGLEQALAAALAHGGPYLVDAVVDPGNYRDVLEAVRGGAT